jgi:hypothetical protein
MAAIMKVIDFQDEFEVHSPEELESELRNRCTGEARSFWLHHESSLYPVMLVLVRNRLAFLHFFPSDSKSEPGSTSVGNIEGIDPEGTTEFRMDGEPEHINNDTIIPFDRAIAAAKEFHATGELPACVEWNEL